MNYPDGTLAHLGDRLIIWDDVTGVVVCSIDTAEYSPQFSENEWAYLERGVMIQSSRYGLFHYVDPEPTFVLLERSSKPRQS